MYSEIPAPISNANKVKSQLYFLGSCGTCQLVLAVFQAYHVFGQVTKLAYARIEPSSLFWQPVWNGELTRRLMVLQLHLFFWASLGSLRVPDCEGNSVMGSVCEDQSWVLWARSSFPRTPVNMLICTKMSLGLKGCITLERSWPFPAF